MFCRTFLTYRILPCCFSQASLQCGWGIAAIVPEFVRALVVMMSRVPPEAMAEAHVVRVQSARAVASLARSQSTQAATEALAAAEAEAALEALEAKAEETEDNTRAEMFVGHTTVAPDREGGGVNAESVVISAIGAEPSRPALEIVASRILQKTWVSFCYAVLEPKLGCYPCRFSS